MFPWKNKKNQHILVKKKQNILSGAVQQFLAAISYFAIAGSCFLNM